LCQDKKICKGLQLNISQRKYLNISFSLLLTEILAFFTNPLINPLSMKSQQSIVVNRDKSENLPACTFNKRNLEELILENTRVLAADKGKVIDISLHSNLEIDLGFDIFDLSKIIMYSFPAASMVPDASIIPSLVRKKNMQLKDFCNVLYKNLVPLEKIA
jgi:hypothetical protein